MKSVSFASLLIFSLLVTSSCNKAPDETTWNSSVKLSQHYDGGEVIPDHYILFIKEAYIKPASTFVNGQFTNRADKAQFMKRKSDQIIKDIKDFLKSAQIDHNQVSEYYTVASVGFAAKLSTEELAHLLKNENLKAIEYDRTITIPDSKVEVLTSVEKSQITPCNVTEARGPGLQTQGKWIWIVNTGIDTDHPDLNVSTSSVFTKSFVGSTVEDCNGNGTHIAGIAAAKDNTIGTVGLAPGALVVPVKVFNCSGSGSLSGMIAGINHVSMFDIPGDVVSLGFDGFYGPNCSSFSVFAGPIQNLATNGTYVVSSAGSRHGNAGNVAPGCINGNNIYTIGAYRCTTSQLFGNVGNPPIDFVAGGGSILSTHLNGGYAVYSGTAMASATVAGILNARQGAPIIRGWIYKAPYFYPKASVR